VEILDPEALFKQDMVSCTSERSQISCNEGRTWAQHKYSAMNVEDYLVPDITVSCDQRDRNQKDAIRHPCLVIEVLSPTTEAIDRGRKAAYYRASSTIQEYMMVDTGDILVEVHRREDERWTINTFEAGDIVTLESLNIQFSIEDAYEGTSLIDEL
jgi:Uma2 family endonuclease